MLVGGVLNRGLYLSLFRSSSELLVVSAVLVPLLRKSTACKVEVDRTGGPQQVSRVIQDCAGHSAAVMAAERESYGALTND